MKCHEESEGGDTLNIGGLNIHTECNRKPSNDKSALHFHKEAILQKNIFLEQIFRNDTHCESAS